MRGQVISVLQNPLRFTFNKETDIDSYQARFNVILHREALTKAIQELRNFINRLVGALDRQRYSRAIVGQLDCKLIQAFV